MLGSHLPADLLPSEFLVIAYWLRAGVSCCVKRAFAVAAFLRALESRVALALEGAFRVDAAAVSTQPEVLALVNVCSGEGDACGAFQPRE